MPLSFCSFGILLNKICWYPVRRLNAVILHWTSLTIQCQISFSQLTSALRLEALKVFFLHVYSRQLPSTFFLFNFQQLRLRGQWAWSDPSVAWTPLPVSQSTILHNIWIPWSPFRQAAGDQMLMRGENNTLNTWSTSQTRIKWQRFKGGKVILPTCQVFTDYHIFKCHADVLHGAICLF